MVRGLPPRVILAIGFGVFLVYAYPGYMSSDSVAQLVEARTGHFSDWVSPTMTAVWRQIELVLAGPLGMLVLQGALVLGGLYVLLGRAMSARAAALAACAVLLFPPVLATLAVIWPHGQMAGFLAAGAAAIASSRRTVRLAGLGLLLLAYAMLPTAAFAALPIVVLGFVWREGQARWLRHAIGVGVWAAIVLGGLGLDAALTDTATQRRQVALAAVDIAGVLRFAGPIGDARLRAELAGVPLARSEDIQEPARDWYLHPEQILFGPDRLFDPPTTAAARDALLDARDGLARAHPGAYFAHRRRQFRQVLGLSRDVPAWAVYNAFVASKDQQAAVQHAVHHGRVQGALANGMHGLEQMLLFRPYVYFLISICLLPLAAIRRQRDTLTILASGILHELTLLVMASAAEYRSSHWMVLCTVVAVVLLVARGRTSYSGHGSEISPVDE